MNTTAKASDHVKPCNIAQSERHNRRDPDYINSLDPTRLYVRLDLSKNNSSYVAPGMEGVTLEQHRESIRVMVKQKTGRSMQEDDVKYTDKNGKEHTRKGCSPIRESVVNIKEDTTLDNLLDYARMVEARWGIKAIQIHLHKDEGHYEDLADKNSWKPNYHAHIVWDWMDHETGKSFKLKANDMSAMQDMVAEALDMERGRKKSETGLDHLERNDFIIQKQEKEKKRLEEEKRRIQSEKDMAEKKAQKAKEQTRKANEEKDEAEKKAQTAKTELSSAKSKITEKQAVIDRMDEDIEDRSDRLEVLKDMVATSLNEKYAMDYSQGWKESVLTGFSANLLEADQTIGYCVNAIQDYAYSGFQCRGGGKHGDIFWPEEAYAIKKVMTSFAEVFKTTLREIGAWLVWLAHKLAKFNDRELYRADKEVKDIADGRYDGQIRKVENGYGGGLSR
ncbi:MAG: hypothetical protein J6L98_06395 [Bacteroidales bacterium]|nr:hypothetical protein [Bacteroidales bacterium]